VAYTFHAMIFAYDSIELYKKEEGSVASKSSTFYTWSWIGCQSCSIIWDIIPICLLLFI